MTIYHVNQYDGYPWCGADPYAPGNEMCGGSGPEDPYDGTCFACLSKIVEYGTAAALRLFKLAKDLT